MATRTMSLDAFTSELRSVFGDDLTTVVLYGSAASRAAEEPESSQNVLVIVRTLQPDALRRAAAATSAWQQSGNPAPLILTAAEWRSSRDVFAMEHLDILQRHRIAHGALPVQALPTDSDLRRQLEYEAMGALIHLRQGILICNGDHARELDLLAISKGTVLALFRSLLRLHGAPVPADTDEAIRAAAAAAKLDAAPFLAVAAHVRGSAKLSTERADETLTAYHAGLKQFVAHVDAMVHPESPAVD
jgi:hypothetical protein